MCFALGASIAEIVSAFPTCGGLLVQSLFLHPKTLIKYPRYTASAQLCRPKNRAIVRPSIPFRNSHSYFFDTGRLGSRLAQHFRSVHLLSPYQLTITQTPKGQIAGVASTEFGLSNMIWAAVSIGRVRLSSFIIKRIKKCSQYHRTAK